MMNTQTTVLTSQLWRTVESLSLPAAAQAEVLRDQSLAVADELALEFDDVFMTVPRLVAEGALPAAAVPPLTEIDRLLAEMSDDPSRWDVAALATDPGWASVRQVAQRALTLLQPAA
jgi:hypothetical protein